MAGQEVNVVRAVIIEPLTDTVAEAVLLHKRPQVTEKTIAAGEWQMPGGKIERSETSEQAILRELREEFGFTPDSWTIFEQLDGIFGNEEWPYHAFLIVLTDDTELDKTVSLDAAQSDFFTNLNFVDIAFDHRKVISQGLVKFYELTEDQENQNE